MLRLPVSVGLLSVGSLVLGALGGQAAALRDPPTITIAMPPVLIDVEVGHTVAAAPEPATVRPIVAPTDLAAFGPEDFAFVITIQGVSYVQLTTEEAALAVKHGRTRLIAGDDGVISAVAPVAVEALPESLQAWEGKTVLVEGTCAASVTGFARIARVTGDPGYAGLTDDAWTTKSVVADGDRMLAARLDKPCKGTWARDAAKPPIVGGVTVQAPKLVAAAQADLYRSELATHADTDWNSASWGEPAAADWRTVAALESKVVRHASTGERWIILHAQHGGGCGERSVNLAAIYRANPDGSVKRMWSATDGGAIDRLLDVDGDGRFELLTTSGFGPTTSLRTLDDEALGAISLTYFGCPC